MINEKSGLIKYVISKMIEVGLFCFVFVYMYYFLIGIDGIKFCVLIKCFCYEVEFIWMKYGVVC